MKSDIIIAASSGIGRGLAKVLSTDGCRLGIVARRTELLVHLQAELAGPAVIRTGDVSRPELAMQPGGRHRRKVYVTRRWRLIAWLLRAVPDALYSRL